MLRILRVVAINFALLSSLLVILFVLVPLADQAWPDNPPQRYKGLPNYRQADWVDTHFAEWAGLGTEYHSFVGWRRSPFAGQTIVIEAPYGERRTPLPAGAAEPSVYFFGGSAMWGTGARDQDTIPALYAQATGRIARNFGESGYIAHQGLEMLLWLLATGQRPDVVVFYDGVNDVAQKCVAGHNLFSHAQEGRISSRLRNSPGSLAYFATPLLGWFGDNDVLGSDCDDDPAKAKAVAQSILDDWKTARAVAEAHGIRFYAVLQPVIYSSQTLRDHLKPKGREEERRRQFEAVYPLLRAELNALGFADFTEVLDVDEYIYIDYCHLSPNGNALIAEAMTRLVE
jgi:lysophospholipase L1-like esterase